MQIKLNFAYFPMLDMLLFLELSSYWAWLHRRSVCREARESSPNNECIMFNMGLWVLSYTSQDIYCNYMQPLYSTVHEDLVIPLSPYQISYCKFCCLPANITSFGVASALSDSSQPLSLRPTVLEFAQPRWWFYTTSMTILLYTSFSTATYTWDDKLGVWISLLCFCDRHAFKAHRLFNQPSLRDPLLAKSLGRSYVAIEMILHPQNQCAGRRLFLCS